MRSLVVFFGAAGAVAVVSCAAAPPSSVATRERPAGPRANATALAPSTVADAGTRDAAAKTAAACNQSQWDTASLDVRMEPNELHVSGFPSEFQAHVELAVLNCSLDDLALVQLDVLQATGRVSYTFEPVKRLPSGASSRVDVKMWRPGKHAVVAYVRSGDAGVRILEAEVVRVVDDALVHAQAECRACNGVWGSHGMSGAVGCLCRTTDGGRECRDGLECEGSCELPRSGSVGWVGRCSEFVTTFGCRTVLPAGFKYLVPQPTHLAQKCTD